MIDHLGRVSEARLFRQEAHRLAQAPGSRTVRHVLVDRTGVGDPRDALGRLALVLVLGGLAPLRDRQAGVCELVQDPLLLGLPISNVPFVS